MEIIFRFLAFLEFCTVATLFHARLRSSHSSKCSVVFFQTQQNKCICKYGFELDIDCATEPRNNFAGLNQVGSLTQFYYVGFLQSVITVQKCDVMGRNV